MRFLELDALRGIAVIIVVVFHLTLNYTDSSILKIGTTGVDLFFMISGFVILHSISNVKNIKEFIINRFSRLYPTYWIAVTFTFSLLLIYFYLNDLEISNLIIQYFGNMTMFQFYLGINNLDGPYWTLIIELLFYLFILIFFILKQLNQFWLIGLLVSFITALFNLFIPNNPVFIFLFYSVPLFQFLPLFTAGIIFYYIKNKQHKYYHHFGIILCLVFQIGLFKTAGRSQAYIDIYSYSIALTSYFVIFYLFVLNRLKIIISTPLLFFGKISYSLYLIHEKLSIGFIIPILHNKVKINYWVTFLVAICFSIIIAYLLNKFVEIPFNRKIRSLMISKSKRN